MDCAIDVGLVNEQAFFIYCKLAVALPYFVRCGLTEDILLLGWYHFDRSRWGVLCFLIKRISVRYFSCTTYVLCDGMYQDG